MNWWQRLTQRPKMEERLDRELSDHLERHTADLIAHGHRPDEARRLARLELGGPEQVKEDCRDARGTRWLEDLWHDFRYAARILRQRPGFTAVGAITLALGIGAGTAIFSAVNPILFEPLPYPQARRIMMIWDIFQGARSQVTFHSYREMAARSHSFEALAVMDVWQPTITTAGRPERFDGQSVSAGYFRVLGVSPALGRDFQEADDQFKGPHVTILSDALWRRHFGADTAIVGRRITLDGDLYTVIGVMPPGFDNVLAPSTVLWSPLQYDSAHIGNFDTGEWGHHLRMVGRLRPGFGVDRARQELNAIALAPVREFPRPPWANLKVGLIVNSLQGEVTRGVKPVLLAFLGAVLLVLLIASVNVTNLLLARGAQRRGEFSMRAALGAARPRLMRQLLTESLLLTALGGVLGVMVAEAGVDALVALSPAGLPRVGAIAVNGSVFAFALGMTTVVGLLVGLIPALQASRGGLVSGIQLVSRRTAGGRLMTRRVLVVAEVALAIVLLVSAGLLWRSLARVFSIPPGFDAARLLTMQVQYNGHRYDANSVRRRFLTSSLDAVRHVPGVAAAAFSSLLPLSGDQNGVYGAEFEDGRGYGAFRYVMSPGYCQAMGIALRRGRLLDEHDGAAAPPAVLISESLARRQFPNQDPIGRRVHVGPLNRPFYTIVGVVGDVKQGSLVDSQTDAVYLTPEQSWFADDAMTLVVRAHDNVTALAPAIKSAVWSIDKDQPIVRTATMESLLAVSESQRRFAMIVFEAFALVALVLAATGIYGVLSGSVTERMHELGVRAALGASRRQILALVIRQGMTLASLGVACGLAAAVVATEALITLLFGISRLDLVTYSGVIALLAAVSAIACWVPAWRASRVDPAITLRAE
ncbi:MAG TPA: ABC transporter permease [Bryobacteraceae bacterium]|nr:ABC transporter permease [Bryobacteraceae bacterium]